MAPLRGSAHQPWALPTLSRCEFGGWGGAEQPSVLSLPVLSLALSSQVQVWYWELGTQSLSPWGEQRSWSTFLGQGDDSVSLLLGKPSGPCVS